MACKAAKPAWKTTNPNENGKHPLRFSYRDEPPDYWIGCGKCELCAAQKSRDWAIRIYHESMEHERNCFLTLTYEDPPEKINTHDLKKFIKRLRHHSEKPVRYFITGEYGEKTHRPHYHAIIFGEDFLGGAYDINDRLYGNVILDRIWKHGQVSAGEFTLASAMYTAGYVNKKINDKDTFSVMSRRPPLGREWLKRNHDNIRRMKNVVINGQEFPVPQVYFQWLEGIEIFDDIREEKKNHVRVLTDQEGRAKEANYKGRKALKSHKI